MRYRLKKFQLRTRRWWRSFEKRYRDHPRLLPVVAALMVVLIAIILVFSLRDSGITAKLTDANIVILHVDNSSQVLPTREETVGAFLEKANIILNEGDVVEPGLDTPIKEDDFRINVYRGQPVVVVDGYKRTYALSAARTPRSVVEQVGLEVFPEDLIETNPSDDFLRDGIGAKVSIKRSTPANLNLYGTALSLRTHAKTVGELLKEKNIQLATDDTVLPSLDTTLTSQVQVFVTRVGTQVVTEEQTIPMPTETVQDNSLSFGAIATRQKGAAGKKSVTFQLELRNGVEVSRVKIQEVVTLEPVKQIIARGQAVSIPSDRESIMRAAGISASDFPYVNYIINHENGLWCATRWQGQNSCPPYYQEKYPGAETDTSLGYGLCQSTPAIKMAANGADWRTNPVTQLKWCSGYATSRYGSWKGAYDAWTAREAQGRGWW
ncbi:DUF348 domain-containing protein [Candidatus Saccharibacteria bacterium]|nr:DUF348 domain-containing protein [Candidatus Saccharibacteria bacterium]